MSENSSLTQLSLAKPKVLLLGDGPTALTALRSLVESCHVLGVLRAPDGTADPVRAYARKRGIAVEVLENVRELRSVVLKLRPQAVVISSFNRLLSPDVLTLNKFVNVHYAPLPRYRGRANVNWAIINGEPAAAISIHLVAPDLDDGNILFQEQVTIGPNDTAQSIYEKLNAIQERELGRAVGRAVAGDPGIGQDHEKATYGCGRVPDDGEIEWSNKTDAIDRLIRALSPPFPGAFTHLETTKLFIVRAEPRKDAPRYEGRVPGRVVGRSRAEGWVDVLTGDGILRLFEIMSESTGTVPAAQIIRSTRTTLGLSRVQLLQCISDLQTRLAALESAVRAAGATTPREQQGEAAAPISTISTRVSNLDRSG
ncbi:MAG TPA: formyltransferase family protein [Pseudolabrys sp.]|nr:formyltransferase family protein [Pseudolabrys sp.]